MLMVGNTCSQRAPAQPIPSTPSHLRGGCATTSPPASCTQPRYHHPRRHSQRDSPPLEDPATVVVENRSAPLHPWSTLCLFSPPRQIEPNFSHIAVKLGTESRGPRGGGDCSTAPPPPPPTPRSSSKQQQQAAASSTATIRSTSRKSPQRFAAA
jgi:hypothetical protein